MGEQVTFVSRSQPGSSAIVGYAWELGTALAATQGTADTSVTTTYNQAGTYKVALTVTDENGLSDTATHEIVIRETATPTPPTAIIEGPSNATVGEEVTFVSRSQPGSSPIVGYAWELSALATSQTASESSVTTAYNTPGVHQVALTVTDENGLSDSTSHQIVVNASLEGPTWALSGALPGAGITIQFASGALSGFAGCNSYNGSYSGGNSGSAGAISISNLTSTQMACSPEVMQKEQTYLSALGTANSYQIQGSSLNLNYSGGTLVFYDQSGPQPR